MMPYLALDDRFSQHPKILPLSDAAFRLHVAGLNYCAAYMTDGLVPAGALAQLVPRYRVKTLEELLTAALWAKSSGLYAGYEIHDYLDWNWSRDRIEQRKISAAAGARARWGQRINGVSHASE